MGLLGSLFGAKTHHPELEPSSEAARRLEQQKGTLEAFAGKVKDRLELVPAQEAIYAFVGKPPGTFGIAWFTAGEEHNLKTMMQARGLSAQQGQAIAEQLRDCYTAHQEEPRYQATLADHPVTVTPSDAFAHDLERIIHRVSG